MYINAEQTYFACNTSYSQPDNYKRVRIFHTKVVFVVSVWSFDPLAEIVQSADDTGQREQPL